ncbi:glycosyltransferase [Microbacterium sp. BWT-B31]|uniref:glycosyltransferase n=1 Tax=Microbacterium sp. BWT-B31 TaxID=3232072 RepID=UPI0035276012
MHADDEGRRALPSAHYVILSSRIVPDLDGGFTVATLRRARQMADAGADANRGPLLLTVDPGTTADHAAHRAALLASGQVQSTDVFCNLFDELRADPSWAYDRAKPAEGTPRAPLRAIVDDADRPVAGIPVVDSPEWFLTDAPVVVHGADGDRFLRGFRGLYHAWLDHVVARLTRDTPRTPVVVVCESRQVGLLIADWANPRVRIVHTIHTSHLEPPYTADAPVNALWRRWFDAMPAFDAVLWPTRQQRDDVEARFGSATVNAVVPHAAPPVAADPAQTVEPRAVILARLAPVKRIAHAVRAWAQVVREIPGARLDIYGDGPLRADLEREIDDLGVGDRVTLHGHTDRGAAVFDGAAFAFQTSAYEGQGLAPLEAMSRGCPVLSYDVRYGPRDRAAVGGEVLVESGDVDALAAAAIRLLADAPWRARMSAGALACAEAFSASCTTVALGDALRAALAGPARRGATGQGTAGPGTTGPSTAGPA